MLSSIEKENSNQRNNIHYFQLLNYFFLSIDLDLSIFNNTVIFIVFANL